MTHRTKHHARDSIALALWVCMTIGLSATALAETAPPPTACLEPIEEPRASAADASSPAVKPDSEVTVRKRGQERVEEFRLKGRLYMIHAVWKMIGPP